MARLDQFIDQGASFSGNEANCAFLNLGRAEFLDVSGLSGFAVTDDTRAVLPVDWDGDGGMDVFLINRTGPQLRFFRNAFPARGGAFSLGLQGKNAIGASVSVNGRRESIKAGEGFLSQPSQQIHMGLNDAKSANVAVRWADGTEQQLTNLQAGKRYKLTFGNQTVVPLPAQQGLNTTPAPLADAGILAAGAMQFPIAWPMPPLPLADGTTCLEFTKPTVLRLYDGTCNDCSVNHKRWSDEASKLANLGMENVVLWHTKPPPQLPQGWKNHAASEKTLHFLQTWQRRAFSVNQPLPTVCHWIISAQGEVLGLHRGPLDLDALSETSKTPFGGHWARQPEIPDPLVWFSYLVTNKCWASAAGYLAQHSATLKKHPSFANMAASLAAQFTNAGRPADAIAAYEASLTMQQNPAVLNNLAYLYLPNSPEKALSAAKQAVEFTNQKDPVFLESLAEVAVAVGNTGLAKQAITAALAVNPTQEMRKRLENKRQALK